MDNMTPEDKGEYDYEGDMAKSQLRSILANAKRLHDMLEENTNLPEWVQSKITLAEDYILTAANYMEGEMNEGYGGKFPKEWQKEMEKIPSTSTVRYKDKTVVTTKKDGKVVGVKTTKNEEMKPYVKAAQKKFDDQAKSRTMGKKQAGTLSAKKERDQTKQAIFAQKAVDIAKGRKNRINKEPKVEFDVKV
jgi:hypothetical protein